MTSLRGRAASFLISLATALAIIALVIPLFFNPWWLSFEQGRAEATAWTGFTEADLRTVMDAILADLVVGPPDFDVELAGTPVLNARERAHMQDVRTVFMGFFIVAAVIVALAVAIVGRRRSDPAARAASWRAIRSGAVGLIVGLLLVGGFALIAFDILFEAFHRLFFAGGTYTFDPATERLVQLLPFRLWQETAITFGVVATIVAAAVAIVAQRRLDRLVRAADGAPLPAALGGPAT